MSENKTKEQLLIELNFPYPIAIFTRDGVLRMANQTFFSKTNRNPAEVSEGRINMLNRLTTENYEILEAVQEIFSGETRLVKNLNDPLSVFVRDEDSMNTLKYESAIFFPLVEGNGQITYGVVMFMK